MLIYKNKTFHRAGNSVLKIQTGVALKLLRKATLLGVSKTGPYKAPKIIASNQCTNHKNNTTNKWQKSEIHLYLITVLKRKKKNKYKGDRLPGCTEQATRTLRNVKHSQVSHENVPHICKFLCFGKKASLESVDFLMHLT